MEDDLTSLESQLERAKLAHSARCSRLEASKASETETFPNSKRVLFPGKAAVVDRQTTLDPDLQGKMDQWTPQLDLCETKVSTAAGFLPIAEVAYPRGTWSHHAGVNFS